MTRTQNEHSEIYLSAGPKKKEVWAFLTDPDKLAIWFHKPDRPLKAGEPLAMYGAKRGDKVIWGEVLRAEPHDLLSYTFIVGPMGDAVSTVTWTLEEVAAGTRLSLMHEGIPEGAAAFDLTLAFDKGWDDHIGRMRVQMHETVPA